MLNLSLKFHQGQRFTTVTDNWYSIVGSKYYHSQPEMKLSHPVRMSILPGWDCPPPGNSHLSHLIYSGSSTPAETWGDLRSQLQSHLGRYLQRHLPEHVYETKWLLWNKSETVKCYILLQSSRITHLRIQILAYPELQLLLWTQTGISAY